MLSAPNDGKEDRPVRSVARYLREPVWAFGAAEPAAALRLVGKTMRHHCANWLRRGRDDGSQFTVALDLGASHPSIVTLRAVGGDIAVLYENLRRGGLLRAGAPCWRRRACGSLSTAARISA